MVEPRVAQISRSVEAIAMLSHAFAAQVGRPFGATRLGGRHLDVLFQLARRSPQSMSELAVAGCVTRGAMTQAIDPLRAAGLVDVAPDPADGRGRQVALTDRARAEIMRFEADYVAAVADAFDDLSDTEVSDLADILSRVVAQSISGYR